MIALLDNALVLWVWSTLPANSICQLLGRMLAMAGIASMGGQSSMAIESSPDKFGFGVCAGGNCASGTFGIAGTLEVVTGMDMKELRSGISDSASSSDTGFLSLGSKQH